MTEEPVRVLVVDDELGMREGCRKILEPEGYVVETAEDGVAGLERFREQGNFAIALEQRGAHYAERLRERADFIARLHGYRVFQVAAGVFLRSFYDRIDGQNQRAREQKAAKNGDDRRDEGRNKGDPTHADGGDERVRRRLLHDHSPTGQVAPSGR